MSRAEVTFRAPRRACRLTASQNRLLSLRVRDIVRAIRCLCALLGWWRRRTLEERFLCQRRQVEALAAVARDLARFTALDGYARRGSRDDREEQRFVGEEHTRKPALLFLR